MAKAAKMQSASVPAEKKVEAKAAPVVEKKTALTEAPAAEKKIETAAAPATAKKAEKKSEKKAEAKQAAACEELVYIQFAGSEWDVAELTAKAKAAYVAEGHRASSIKKFNVYVKPEERKAYYVVNDKATGSISF